MDICHLRGKHLRDIVVAVQMTIEPPLTLYQHMKKYKVIFKKSSNFETLTNNSVKLDHCNSTHTFIEASDEICRRINRDCEVGNYPEPQRPQDHRHKTYSPETTYNKRTTCVKYAQHAEITSDYQKEGHRKLRFQALNRNGEYTNAPVHSTKVSKSCSPKDPVDDEDLIQKQSSVLQKKRERYHSQRRKNPIQPSNEILARTNNPRAIGTKCSAQSNQEHPLGRSILFSLKCVVKF